MKNYNKIVKELRDTNSVTKLYKRIDNSFYIIKRNLEGKIIKSKMNISYSDTSSNNKINALELFKSF